MAGAGVAGGEDDADAMTMMMSPPRELGSTLPPPVASETPETLSSKGKVATGDDSLDASDELVLGSEADMLQRASRRGLSFDDSGDGAALSAEGADASGGDGDGSLLEQVALNASAAAAAEADSAEVSLSLSAELAGGESAAAGMGVGESLVLDESPVRAKVRSARGKREGSPGGPPPKAKPAPRGGARGGTSSARTSREAPATTKSAASKGRARPASASSASAFRSSGGLSTTSSNDALARSFAELQEQVAHSFAEKTDAGATRASARQFDAAQRQWAKREADLERQVEMFRREAAAETAKAKKAIDAQQRRAVKERADRSELERRNRELAREKAELLKQLSELQKEQPRDRLKRAANEEQVTLAATELEEVRRGIAEQETLIAGFQRENERLSKELKEAKAAAEDTSTASAGQVEALERELIRARDEAQVQRARAEAAGAARETEDGDDAPSSPSEGLSNERVLSAEVERLQTEIEAHKQREMDLKFELDRARTARKELEQRYEGIDPRRVVAEDAALAEARETLARERAAHERQLSELEDKIKWYANNQELITANDEQLKTQRKRIAQLEEQLQFHEGATASKPGTGASAGSSDRKAASKGNVVGRASDRPRVSAGGAGGGAGAKRVKELEARVRELEMALEERGSSSIASLVAASRPRVEESSEVKRLHDKIGGLVDELETSRTESQRKLRALRQEYDRLRVNYDSAINDSKKKVAAAEKREADVAKRGGANAAKVRDLERQVEELRRFYSRKCRGLQEQLDEANKTLGVEKEKEDARKAKAKENRIAKQIEKERQERLNARQEAQSGAETGAAGARPRGDSFDPQARALADAEKRLRLASQQLAERDAQLLQLEGEAMQLRTVVQKASTFMVPDPKATAGDTVTSGTEALRTSVEVLTLREELSHLTDRYNELVEARARGGGLASAAQGGPEPANGRQADALVASREAVQRLYMEAVEKAASLRLQHAEELASARQAHAAEMRTVVAAAEAHAEEARRATTAAQAQAFALPGEVALLRQRAEKAELELKQARERIESLQRAYEAAAAAARKKEAPGAAELAALQEHVARLEAQAARREAQWRGVCDDIKRMTVAESAVAERRWQLRLESKNQEIERFKAELDSMLGAAEQLQEQLGTSGASAVGAAAAFAAGAGAAR
eukprot:PRCOL_00003117-RA